MFPRLWFSGCLCSCAAVLAVLFASPIPNLARKRRLAFLERNFADHDNVQNAKKRGKETQLCGGDGGRWHIILVVDFDIASFLGRFHAVAHAVMFCAVVLARLQTADSNSPVSFTCRIGCPPLPFFRCLVVPPTSR